MQPQKDKLLGFWSLFITQFQGAFSDNILKNLVVFMIIGLGVSMGEKHRIGELVGALFSVPFILFSMAGGFLADRFSKRTVVTSIKVFEIGVMATALYGFYVNSLPILLSCVFLMGTHSAFFGPSKYGILPELLTPAKLSWGNGVLEFGTFTAIILGTVAAGYMSVQFKGQQAWSGAILLALAGLGLFFSLGVSKVPPAAPAKKFRFNFVSDIITILKKHKRDRPLTLAIAGNAFFNFIGALVLLNLFFYGATVLKVNEIQTSQMCAALALGIGIGSILAGYLSGKKIEYGLIPFGALGLGIAAIGLALPGATLHSAFIYLACLGLAGGFYIVPIAALLQHRPAADSKGEVQAVANLLSFVGVFLASGAHYLCTLFQLSPRDIFLAAGVLTLVGAIYAVWLLPDALLRFVLWILTTTVYRIHTLGRQNVPAEGGALLVCNHLSMVDALLLQSASDRPIRLVIAQETYNLPWIKPFAKVLNSIPIPEDPRCKEMQAALNTAQEALKQGELVGLFAEGQITRTGQMLPFRKELERIMRDTNYPIIPVALDGLWGSIFSYEGQRLWRLPRRIPYHVNIAYGSPLPATASSNDVRQAVQFGMSSIWEQRKVNLPLLHRAFLRTARKHPFRFAMGDSSGKLSFGKALMQTFFISKRIASSVDQLKVGILLPPSNAGTLVNLALLFQGRTPVNLNYTVSQPVLNSCVRQCGIKQIITSRTVLAKLKMELPETTLFLEDLVDSPTFVEKTIALFSVFLPAFLIERLQGLKTKTNVDDIATIIFSSGSTGQPKGVLLSHANIMANVMQLEQVFGLNSRDRVLGILPFFHSFGFTGTLCLPAILGVGVSYHPNPLDTKAIGPLVRDNKVTFMLATPTFLQFYLRTCAPEDFGSLRVVMTGAEKLPERVAAAFEEKFLLRPLEGYGCSECAPAVAVNTLGYRAAGMLQIGNKRGKIGMPLPGISVKIVDPATQAPLPVNTSGLLLVKGPNIMLGYLGLPEKTAEVLKDGWYNTGDIAMLDDDGFLQITDRLSRFSKIGGEMVPHIKIEENLHTFAGVNEQTFVVVGVADEKKGERLIVVHKALEEVLKRCLDGLNSSDLPNLWKPKAENFVQVKALPYLGTGKLDLCKVKELATQNPA